MGNGKIESFKEYLVDKFERYGYQGFSFEVDRYFDPYSCFLTVVDRQGRIVATSRPTLRRPENILPFEMGLRADGGKYVLDEGVPVGDVNSFSYSDLNALPLLNSCLGLFAVFHGVEKAFCLLDEGNRRIVELYTLAGFVPSPKYPERIHYPGYGRTIDGTFRATWWTIMEMDHDTIRAHAQATRRYEILGEIDAG